MRKKDSKYNFHTNETLHQRTFGTMNHLTTRHLDY